MFHLRAPSSHLIRCTAKACILDITRVAGWNWHSIRQIEYRYSKAATAQNPIPILRIGVWVSHPFPNIAYHVKDTKWAFVKRLAAHCVGVLVGQAESLSLSRDIV